MKKHTELVKKFLDDNTSVTEEELKANIYDAFDAWSANDYVEYASFRAARAAYWVDVGDPVDAEFWEKLAIEAVAEYEELTK